MIGTAPIMADKQLNKPKRLVKNPETFRERAVKAAEASDKPKRTTKLKELGSQAASPVFKPIGQASGKFFALKPLVWLRKPLRLIGKIIFPVYFRNSWRELRQVEWPNWRQSRQLTFAVLVFAVIFGAAIAIVDYGLDKVFKDVLLK
jgi:preprotein translocase SecE subunit